MLGYVGIMDFLIWIGNRFFGYMFYPFAAPSILYLHTTQQMIRSLLVVSCKGVCFGHTFLTTKKSLEPRATRVGRPAGNARSKADLKVSIKVHNHLVNSKCFK
jgi:hypothetical protein